MPQHAQLINVWFRLGRQCSWFEKPDTLRMAVMAAWLLARHPPHLKRKGYSWSYLTSRIGRFVPIWQPYIGSSNVVQGSFRTTHKGYEEVHVPPLKPKPFSDGERLVKIQELPEWMHPAFAGMKELNRIQSKVCSSLKPTGYSWSYLASRIGHLVPIWQPHIGSRARCCASDVSLTYDFM
jgi:hypothetical protein